MNNDHLKSIMQARVIFHAPYCIQLQTPLGAILLVLISLYDLVRFTLAAFLEETLIP